jgi:hypothetical protein
MTTMIVELYEALKEDKAKDAAKAIEEAPECEKVR